MHYQELKSYIHALGKPAIVGARALYSDPADTLAHSLWFDTAYGEKVPIFDPAQEYPGHIWIPRGLVPKQYAEPAPDNFVSEGHPINLEIVVGPRNQMQKGIIEKAAALLLAGDNHIIQAATGIGKTYCAIYLAAVLGRTTLVVVTKDQLMSQWRDEIHRFTGLPLDKIGMIQQDVCKVDGCPIVVAMMHSLVKDKYPSHVFDYFGLVVFDEVHRLGADYFSNVAGKFSARYRLGLSATPIRKDGKFLLFFSHIGPVGVVADSAMLIPRVIVIETNTPHPESWRKDSNGRWERGPMRLEGGRLGGLFKALANDTLRNSIIKKVAVQAYQKDRNTVVFSENAKEHLINIATMMIQEGVPKEDIGFFTPTLTKKKDLLEHKHRKVVLTTYAMCAEAIDMPKWDTAILGTPRADVMQIIGRILREKHGKKRPVVVDLLDNRIKMMQSMYGKRVKQYETLKANVVFYKVKNV